MSKSLIILTIFALISFQFVSGFWADPPALLKVFLDSASMVEQNDLTLPHTSKVCITDLPTVRSANQAETIRNELLLALEKLPDVSDVFTNLISKAADTISELMSDGNSTLLLKVTGKTGRMFSDTTTSFAKLLTTTDEFLIFDEMLQQTPSKLASTETSASTTSTSLMQEYMHPAYDTELIASKLKLIETTKSTLADFLSELSNLAEISFEESDKTKDILQAEELLIDKTKESYQIVYDTTNKILRQILDTDFASKPVKKIIAARVLRSAVNNINAFANLRKNISQALADAALKHELGDITVEDFHKHIQNEILASTLQDDDTNLPLNTEEKQELENFMNDQNTEDKE